VPIVDRDQENLQESTRTVDPKPVSKVAGSLYDISVVCGKSEMYVSGNPSVSRRPTLNTEVSLKGVESVAIEESLREARQSQVSVLGTGMNLTQDWTSMRDDEDSERYESQVESLHVASEKPEPSVRELAKIAPQGNLQESITAPDSKVESELAESQHQTDSQHQDSDRYLSSDRSLSQKPS
jgi:hypothetical protein